MESTGCHLKLLWVKSDFLHPTTRGGQIRSLEMLRCLHQRHEVHYLAFRSPGDSQGLDRSSEYCARAYPVDFTSTPKDSLRFGAQLAAGLFDPVPLAVSRFRSVAMRSQIAQLMAAERFDRVVCDFLVPAVNFPSLKGTVLFQHNVESSIWRRRVEHARNPLERFYLERQAKRMWTFERDVCRAVDGVIAVSELDAAAIGDLFAVDRVGAVPTGVNVEYFHRPPDAPSPGNDLIFIGSMDWAPNESGILEFVRSTLPLIRRDRPATSLLIVGRDPSASIRDLAQRYPNVVVTGTVPDVRPYLWRSLVSIVPLHVGGGTRLKIYEAMAAGVATVSTSIGAEGIVAGPGEIRIADQPEQFARECLLLLDNAGARSALANSALALVSERFSWNQVTRRFEDLLDQFGPPPG
jgi:glycosyltransferase involved in cell wall biosynthesis